MKRAPRPPREPVINRDMAIGIGVVGFVDVIAILTVFWLGLQRYPGHLAAAQTIAFVTLCTSELVRAFAARSEYHSVFSIGLGSNRWMVWAVGASFLLVLMVVYVPFLQPFFDTVPLTVDDWLLMAPFFFASAIAMEVLKVYFRSREARQTDTKHAARAAAAASAAHFSTVSATGLSGFEGGAAMLKKILIPVDGSPNGLFAVKHVVKQFMNNTGMEIHLLNVQPPFNKDITRFVSRKSVHDYHLEQAEKALRPVRQEFDKFGIPYSVHIEVGDRAEHIAGAAHRLHCEEIVMGTARKNSLTRLLEQSVTNRLLELTEVPVEIIAGNAVSRWERYGLPAGLGALIALVLAAVAE
jgi:nucleotide-binding universal stress UspA family protein